MHQLIDTSQLPNTQIGTDEEFERLAKPQQYVLCYARPKYFQYWPEVLLIEKKKPAWQAGRYNLPGGKVEEYETIHEAARRELAEETNIFCAVDDVSVLGTIEGEFGIVYVCRCEYDSLRGANPLVQVESERVFWLPIAEALREERLMENLRCVIPLCESALIGWTITHYPNSDPNEFMLSVQANAKA